MQYQVPQFIEVEDKIFGPLTFRQFVYLAGAGGISLIFFTIFPLWFSIFLSVPFVVLGVALAFYQVNGRPLIVAVEHASQYYFGGKLYLWRQREAKQPVSAQKLAAPPAPVFSSVSQSKLKDLAWSLNIKI